MLLQKVKAKYNNENGLTDLELLFVVVVWNVFISRLFGNIVGDSEKDIDLFINICFPMCKHQ